MARKPRIHLPGGIYHVILRGNAGQAIFPSDADRFRLYLLLQEGAIRFGYRIHAFCLMTNHLHLVIQVGEIPLSRAMQNLSLRYTGWINRRERRTGHLFQGRYKALLVDRDSYLLELVRYIHLNPVRVGVGRDPAEYRWSSHRAYLGKEIIPWLTTDWVLGQLGGRKTEARRRFGSFVLDGIGEGQRLEFQRGREDSRVLGDDLFLEQTLAAAGERRAVKPSLPHLVEGVCRSYSITQAELRAAGQKRSTSEARAVLGWLAQETGSCTLTEIAKATGREVATTSSAVRRLIERARFDADLREKLMAIREIVFNLQS